MLDEFSETLKHISFLKYGIYNNLCYSTYDFHRTFYICFNMQTIWLIVNQNHLTDAINHMLHIIWCISYAVYVTVLYERKIHKVVRIRKVFWFQNRDRILLSRINQMRKYKNKYFPNKLLYIKFREFSLIKPIYNMKYSIEKIVFRCHMN